MFDAITRCDGARHRRRFGRYGRPFADAAPPDGGDSQGATRHRQGGSDGSRTRRCCPGRNTGQNALAQVKAFDDALGLTGLVLTKLDGSAKGGVVAAIAKERPIPCASLASARASTTSSRSSAREFVDALGGLGISGRLPDVSGAHCLGVMPDLELRVRGFFSRLGLSPTVGGASLREESD
jgi:hypothetical protein